MFSFAQVPMSYSGQQAEEERHSTAPARADECHSGTDYRRMDLCFDTAMSHQTQQPGIDSG
jgi:hypothetical protein